MITVKHPDSECNVAQETFINSLPDAEVKSSTLYYSLW